MVNGQEARLLKQRCSLGLILYSLTAKGEERVQLAVFSFQSLADETVAIFSMRAICPAVSSVWPLD